MTIDQLLERFAATAKSEDWMRMRTFRDVILKRFHDAERLALLQAAATIVSVNRGLADSAVDEARQLLEAIDERTAPLEERADRLATIRELRAAHHKGYMAGLRSCGFSSALSADTKAAAEQDFPYPPEEKLP